MVRPLGTRRSSDLGCECPGMMNTPISALWWDVTRAPTPAQAAAQLPDLALKPADPQHYGQLIRYDSVASCPPARADNSADTGPERAIRFGPSPLHLATS